MLVGLLVVLIRGEASYAMGVRDEEIFKKDPDNLKTLTKLLVTEKKRTIS